MPFFIHIIEQSAYFVILIGGTLATLFLAFVGIQYATSGGDPQRISQARASFFGILAGMLILGMAFVIPRIISTVVVEPAGGPRLESSYVYGDCDEILRQQLVFQRGARNAQQMRALVLRVQIRFEDACNRQIWNPLILADYAFPDLPYDAEPVLPDEKHDHCFGTHRGTRTIGGLYLPPTLLSVDKEKVVKSSMRDPQNNILVYFHTNDGRRPFNRQVCWVYFSGLDAWYEEDILPTPTP